MLTLEGLKERTTAELIDTITQQLDLDNKLSKVTMEDILQIKEMGDFKPIAKELEPFVGIFPYQHVELPEWWEIFKQQFVDYVSNNIKDEILEDYQEKKLKETQKLLETMNLLKRTKITHLTNSQLPNGNRILKHLKKITELCCNVKEEDVINANWYKLFESKKTTSSEEFVVITPSISSTLGMSSYFENPKYSSCQTLFKDHNGDVHAKGIWSNILDINSLVIYITKPNSFANFRGLDSFKHQAMTVRYILRLIEITDYYKCLCGIVSVNKNPQICANCGKTEFRHIKQPKKIGVMLDRAYPHPQYTLGILKIIEKIAQEAGLTLFIPSNYNSAQEGVFELKTEKIIKTPESFIAMTANPIKAVLTKEADKNCKICESLTETLSCNTCKPYSKTMCIECNFKNIKDRRCTKCWYKKQNVCLGENCTMCFYRPCADITTKGRSHYDDHAGGNSISVGQVLPNREYKKIYQVKIIERIDLDV